MKFFIKNDHRYRKVYYLMTDHREIIDKCEAPNKYFAKIKLYCANEDNKDKLKLLSKGENLEIVFLDEIG